MRRAATIAVVLVSPLAVLAASEAHHEHHGIPWGNLIFSTINTLLFGYILFRFAWPVIRTWVADRRRQIVETLEAAAQAKADAEALKQEWQQRLVSLANEIEQMRAQARTEAARERERILADARRAAENIRRDAARAAEQDLRSASAQLRAEIARRAYTLAAERASGQLSDTNQDRFISDFLRQVTP